MNLHLDWTGLLINLSIVIIPSSVMNVTILFTLISVRKQMENTYRHSALFISVSFMSVSSSFPLLQPWEQRCEGFPVTYERYSTPKPPVFSPSLSQRERPLIKHWHFRMRVHNDVLNNACWLMLSHSNVFTLGSKLICISIRTLSTLR